MLLINLFLINCSSYDERTTSFDFEVFDESNYNKTKCSSYFESDNTNSISRDVDSYFAGVGPELKKPKKKRLRKKSKKNKSDNKNVTCTQITIKSITTPNKEMLNTFFNPENNELQRNRKDSVDPRDEAIVIKDVPASCYSTSSRNSGVTDSDRESLHDVLYDDQLDEYNDH